MRMFDQTPNLRNQRIYVVSLDMDHCIFNHYYNWLPDCNPREVIDKNRGFLDFIRSKAAYYNHFITFVGSARQTKRIDTLCSAKNKTESAFTAIKTISTYLNARLDDFLLADIYFDLPVGTSFQRATDEFYRGEHSTGPNDYTKFTLIYAQVHKVANQYPHNEIVFDFYDDGGIARAKILNDLHRYFSEMPDKLPANIVLNLIHYEGDGTTDISSIRGSGFIDQNYRRTVHEITRYSRRVKNINYEEITEDSLRLDEVVFYQRAALKPPLLDNTMIAIEPISPPAALAIPALPVRPLSLPITIINVFWNLILFLINISAQTEIENEDEDSDDVLGHTP